MKTLTEMKKVGLFNRFVLFAMALSVITSFTACSSDDDDSNIPVYSLTDVEGTYSGTMLTETYSVQPHEDAEEGEKPTGAEVIAEVKDNQIMIKQLPVDDLIKSIVGEEAAEGIIANLDEINYNIPYTPAFNEDKSNILLQLQPEALKINLTIPAQTQEEGEEGEDAAKLLITVSIETVENGVYTYADKKLAFSIKATKVDVAGNELADFPATAFMFNMVKK